MNIMFECLNSLFIKKITRQFNGWSAGHESEVNRRSLHRSGESKDKQNAIYSFSAKHAALRSNHKDWLARDQDLETEKNTIVR